MSPYSNDLPIIYYAQRYRQEGAAAPLRDTKKYICLLTFPILLYLYQLVLPGAISWRGPWLRLLLIINYNLYYFMLALLYFSTHIFYLTFTLRNIGKVIAVLPSFIMSEHHD